MESQSENPAGPRTEPPTEPPSRGRLKLRKRTSVRTAPGVAEPTRGSASLAETLDRVLARGIVARAEVVLSVAEIPLVYVGLQALVSSVETAATLMHGGSSAPPMPGNAERSLSNAESYARTHNRR
ncbi:MAG: gas vesicle protein [Planctomycetota bacterium]